MGGHETKPMGERTRTLSKPVIGKSLSDITHSWTMTGAQTIIYLV